MGEHLLREHSSGYLSNLVVFLLSELLLREPSWEYSSNCDEAIFGVQKASLNIAFDWLRAKSSPVDEEEIKIKMDDGVARYFTRFRGNLPIIC